MIDDDAGKNSDYEIPFKDRMNFRITHIYEFELKELKGIKEDFRKTIRKFREILVERSPYLETKDFYFEMIQKYPWLLEDK